MCVVRLGHRPDLFSCLLLKAWTPIAGKRPPGHSSWRWSPGRRSIRAIGVTRDRATASEGKNTDSWWCTASLPLRQTLCVSQQESLELAGRYGVPHVQVVQVSVNRVYFRKLPRMDQLRAGQSSAHPASPQTPQYWGHGFLAGWQR